MPADDRPPGRRFRALLATGTALLVLVVVGAVASTDDVGRFAPPAPRAPRQAGASATASSETALPAVSPSLDPDLARSDRLREGTAQALQRVAPGAVVEIGSSSWSTCCGAGAHWLLGLARANGRVGGLRVMASRGRPEMACDGYANCRLTRGPAGETIRVVEFARPVPKGQPLDLETRATVLRSGGSWVEVDVDNAEIAYDMSAPNHARPHTGQDPPLTAQQAVAIASDPALDICAAATDGGCAPN